MPFTSVKKLNKLYRETRIVKTRNSRDAGTTGGEKTNRNIAISIFSWLINGFSLGRTLQPKKEKKETTKVSLFRSGFPVCIPTNDQEGKDFQQGIDLRTFPTITLSRFATANNWTCPLILHSRP